MAPRFNTSDIPDLTGKVAIVTGAKRGLGFETTYLLAQAGCTVYLAGRGLSSLEESITRLKTTYPSLSTSNLHPLELDLSSTAASIAAAKSFPGSRLDIIIANAGISLDNNTTLSPDGWERHLQTNHLGHFAFITTLLPLVEATAREHGEARVVVVTSNGYTYATEGLDFSAIQSEVPPSLLGFSGGIKRYTQSKLANILFARELDRRLRERGVENVWVNAPHPGLITSTGLGGTGEQFGAPTFIGKLLRAIGACIGISEREGAMTQTWAATSKQIVEEGIHGQYLVPVLGWTRRYAYSQVEKLKETALDDEAAKKLWELSEKTVDNVQKAATGSSGS
ncbi:hypothetical protein BDD12DRAFT_817013 [Trichophaea hybrida]|nr:hypothetical protein BDD12DRAFT_817013 [Trichophaea hybrida]